MKTTEARGEQQREHHRQRGRPLRVRIQPGKSQHTEGERGQQQPDQNLTELVSPEARSTRGGNCPLASCSETTSNENTTPAVVMVAAAMMPSNVLAVPGAKLAVHGNGRDGARCRFRAGRAPR